MVTYVFPGQGSQEKGMGRELFSQFSRLTAKANAILGYSLEILCLGDPEQRLDQTQYTQPALYTINALSYLKKLQETGKNQLMSRAIVWVNIMPFLLQEFLILKQD